MELTDEQKQERAITLELLHRYADKLSSNWDDATSYKLVAAVSSKNLHFFKPVSPPGCNSADYEDYISAWVAAREAYYAEAAYYKKVVRYQSLGEKSFLSPLSDAEEREKTSLRDEIDRDREALTF